MPTIYKGVHVVGCRHCGHTHWGECPEMRQALKAETPEQFRSRLRDIGVRDSAWKGGSYYSHCLARHPGDKRAYCRSAHEAREKAKRLGLDQNGNHVEIRE